MLLWSIYTYIRQANNYSFVEILANVFMKRKSIMHHFKLKKQRQYCLSTITFCGQHLQWCLVPPVCSFLPGPPDGDVNWTLLFGDIGLEWRAQLNLTTLSQPCIRGGPKVLEVIQHSSVGQCLHLILRQEVDHLLDTPGVTLVGSC
jgi:hypothetical protein